MFFFSRFTSTLACHRRPDRSFFINGKQMPICARCFGCLCGSIIALVLSLFVSVDPLLLLMLCIPMGIDWTIQYFKIKESTNIRRFFTGLPCGFAVNYVYYRAIVLAVKALLQ